MASSPADRLGLVRTLIASAPDSAVRSLELALRGEGAGEALSSIRTLVRDELADRSIRDAVVGPMLPLFTPRADGFGQALFPAGALSRLWRALKQAEPQLVALAASSDADAATWAPDELCRAAVRDLREPRAETADLVRFLEEFRPGSSLLLASYLELTPLAREAVRRLPSWLRSMTNDHVAAVRLLFKDADAIATDGSPRLMEMLMGQLREPWTILRVISAITGRASDRYLSVSELSDFCERVLTDVDCQVAAAKAFDLDAGAEAGVVAARAVGSAIVQIIEFEECLDLAKDGPWGQRVLKQKAAISGMAETCLKKCPKLLAECLPVQPVRIGGVVTRAEPRLDSPPDPRLVRRAQAGLAFYANVRSSAALGGFGSVRHKAGEEMNHRLNSYVEDLLGLMHLGDPSHEAHARAFVDVTAELMALAYDEETARIVRRRAAAA